MKKVEEVDAKLLVSAAEALSTEQWRAEFAEKLKNMGWKSDDPDGSGGGRKRGLLSNPALRNLTVYTGEHAKFSKWRSKVRGIVSGEDPAYCTVLEAMESAHQVELFPQSDGKDEYKEQTTRLAIKLGLEMDTMT